MFVNVHNTIINHHFAPQFTAETRLQFTKEAAVVHPKCSVNGTWDFLPNGSLNESINEKIYTTWKVDGATPMYWFIMAPY